MKKLWIVVIVFVIAALALVAYAGFFTLDLQRNPEIAACTKDLKICPDGSSVARTGVRCEFAACAETVDRTGTHCFARTQIATTAAPYSGSEKVVLVINKNSVSGTKKGTQSGPGVSNGYEGTLSGVLSGNNMELIYSYTVEGSQGKELEVYSFVDENLVKKQWPLKDFEGVLTPERTGEPKTIPYAAEECAVVTKPLAPKPMPPVTASGCYIGGCSSQICSDQKDMVSTCEWTESYACYKTATCERQASGQCGWTETTELRSCLDVAQ